MVALNFSLDFLRVLLRDSTAVLTPSSNVLNCFFTTSSFLGILILISVILFSLSLEFSSFKNNNEWKPSSMEKRRVLKKFKVNENHGTDNWTTVRINFKNTKKPDGKLKVWIDGKLAYDYEGPTNWGKKKHKGHFRNKCYFRHIEVPAAGVGSSNGRILPSSASGRAACAAALRR